MTQDFLPYNKWGMSFKEIDMDEPAHFTWLKSKIGLHAIPGPADNSEIVSWFKFSPDVPRSDWHDSTAWCAVTQNAALELNGGRGTKSGMAISFASWGHEVNWEDALRGDMVVFEWTNSNGDVTGHHVGQFVKQTDGTVDILGGNQLDRPTGFHEVSIKTFGKGSVINVRRAA